MKYECQKDALYLKDRIREGEFSKYASYISNSSSSFWKPVKIQILGPYPRPAGSAALWIRPRNVFYRTLQVIQKHANI